MALSPNQVWQTALGELQLQVTGATFDTWLGRTSLISYEDGTFIVGVHNQHAKDWLENRLLSMIKRTLTGIIGRSVEVRFVVWSQPSCELPAPTQAAEADPTSDSVQDSKVLMLPEMPALGQVGFFPVSRYECTFWATLLGRVPWRVWEIVRGSDIRKEKTDWTPERRWSAPEMARLVPCGPQAIVGVNRGEGRQPGALERLVELQVGQFRRQGQERDPHTMYVVSVRVRLPLLSPVQVMQLSDTLRHQHDRWLEEYGFDPRDWFIELTKS